MDPNHSKASIFKHWAGIGCSLVLVGVCLMLDAHRTGRPLIAFLDHGHPQSAVDAFNVSAMFGIGLLLSFIGVFYGIAAVIFRLAGSQPSVFRSVAISTSIVLASFVFVVLASPLWYFYYAIGHFTAKQSERAKNSVTLAIELPEPERTLALKRLLKEGNEQVQVRVSKELVHMRPSAAVAAPELIEAFMNSNSQHVYTNAYDALMPLGPLLKIHTNELSSALFAEHDKPLFALSLLQAIGPEASDAIPAIINKWKESNDPKLYDYPFCRQRCERALLVIDPNGSTCVPILREYAVENHLQGDEAVLNLISQFERVKD